MASSGMTSPGTRRDSLTTSSPYRVRSQSMSSDRPSTTGYGTMLSPPTIIEPEPVYIAASAASQIVTNDHDSHSEAWFDEHGIEPSGETAMVTPGALRLVNNFLDQLLFNFLAVSKSTSLASLRLAVAEVLKPKLAKEAVNLADQELDEYLGGGEEEELIAFHNGIEPNGDWDLELVWKRTRLRGMVYSSLGDMEEEDEDHYTELEQLDGPPGSTNRYSDQMGIVSPAVAIFLTSILEFMGEQALVAAGQAAYHRIRAKQQKDEREGTSTPRNVADRVVVEDADMERVALDRTLGRLWRGWKKRIRSPNVSISPAIRQSFSRESMRSRNRSRADSVSNEQLVPEIDEVEHEHEQELSMDEVVDDLYAAKIPLPIGDDDVREIEIPGLAEHSDDEEEPEKVEVSKARPKSMMIFTSNTKGLPTPTSSQPTTPALLSSNSRKRSYSLPSPAASTFASPLKKQKSTDAESAEPATESKDVTHSRNASQISHKEGLVDGITADAVTLGAAAGIAAVEKEEVSQVIPATEEDIELEEESDVEIMTSSRISIGDLLTLENAQPPSSNSSVRSPSVRSKRSASVHSIRLIDVQSPRSPMTRHASDDLVPRPGLTRSISGGASTPSSPDGRTSRVSSPVQRISTASPVIRNPSPLNREVRKSSESSLEAVQLQETPPSMPVPDRSPLREVPTSAQFAGIASETEDSTFVLATAPPPRNSRDMKKATVHDIAAAPVSLPKVTPIPTPASIAPPLTPLREMMENALDTSDEASSIAPSYSDAFGRPSDVSSAIGTHDPTIRSRTAASDRSIARSSPPRPQTQRDEDATPRPEAQTRDSRQTRASGSSTSSIKSHKLRPVRTSEDNSPSGAGEVKGQSFEQLIRSETTLQYTLTPQSMRTIVNVPDSPSSKVARPRTGSNNSISKVAGLFSNSPAEIPRSIPSPTASRATSRATSKSGSRIRANAPMARDARVESESIGDFADFIRSTGPPKGRDDFAVGPPSTANSNTGSARTANTSAPRSVPIVSTLPKRSASSARRNRLQARDAVVHGDASSELIDFIRQGPPSSEGNPRIPRSVAPFRSTMDSDQMSTTLSGGRLATLPEARDSLATNVSVEPSLHSSINTVNSGTALLSSHKKAVKAPAVKAPPPQMHNAFEEEEDMMPKRKTRRVKDPYAIDFSDEEDELDAPVAKPKPKRQEESLIDFLNSVPPPPPPPVLTSIFDDVPKPAPKKKDSIMSRFSRSNSGSISHPQTPPVSKPSSSSGSRLGTRTGTPQVATHTHIPITTPQYSFEVSSAGRSQTLPGSRAGNYASQVGDQRKPGARVVQKSYQPREATHVRATRASDLADFLMNTPPPPTVTFTPPPPVKEEGSFAWMFGRKKKVAA